MSELYTFNEVDAAAFYNFLDHQEGDYTEIRAIEWTPDHTGKIQQHFVDNEQNFIKWCRFYTEDPKHRGLYHVYAGVNPRREKSGKAENISRVTIIPFDIDAPHPKDQSATEQEITHARETLNKTVEWMVEQGFNEPYQDFTGNGFRILQAIDIPINEDNRDTVQTQLNIYHETVALNCTVKNAVFDKITDLPRIVKVPGTWNVKGEHTPDRPHRRAHINTPSYRVVDKNLQHCVTSIPVTTPETEPPAAAAEMTYSAKLVKLRPCFRRFATHGNRVSTREDRTDETAMRFAIVEEAYANGFTEAETVELFRKAEDFDRAITRREVNKKWSEIKRKGSRPYRCTTIRNHGACLGPDCQLYEKNIIQKSSKQPTEEEKEPQLLGHITQIENPEFLNEKITVPVIVSGTFRSYAVPSAVRATWYDKEGARREQEIKIDITDPVNMKIPGTSARNKHGVLSNLFPQAGQRAVIKDLDYRTVYNGRIRPPVFTLEKIGGKILDEKGYEYKDYSIYIASEHQIQFPASSLMIITGYVLPDPKSQRTTLLATTVEFPDKVQNYDTKKLDELKAFFGDWTVEKRIAWVLDEFEKYSKIIGRQNIAGAALLGFYTPTFIELDGEIQRGWCNILIIGDNTTGKSQTVKKCISLLQTGVWITAETASTVGLVGAAIQYDKGGWSVDWGFLVLNDRKLLAVDGAQKLYKKHWAALAESERSGIVTIAKAAKDTAYARTRQIKIANPTNPDERRSESVNLDEFLYPVQGAATFLDLQSVARLDLCVFASCKDVNVAAVNKQFTEIHNPLLENLGESLKWVWSSKLPVKYEGKALETLLAKATELYNKFFDKTVPLCSIDMKWKLARMSVALAGITLSTDKNYTTLIVTEEHIKWVADFLDEEYCNAGLNQLVKHSGEAKITKELADQIIEDVGEGIGGKGTPDIEKAAEILQYIAYRSHFTKNQLKDRFNLSRDKQLNPILGKLNTHELIKQSRGYVATSKLNKLIRFMAAQPGFSTLSAFSMDKTDTPIQESDNDKLLDDVAEYFTKMDSVQVDKNHLYTFIEKRHRLTQDGFEAILKGYPELFEFDGWTVKVKEVNPDE